jgi:hypothetical protein
MLKSSSLCLYSSNLGTFWLKIKQFWPFEEISIFSNGGHLGWRAWLSDTILKGTPPPRGAKKGYTGLVVASDKVYQLLAHGRWFSPASSITKTGRHDIAEILLKVALKHQKSINHVTSNCTANNKSVKF